jgi:DNA-binding transcriptional ArsR family regulator
VSRRRPPSEQTEQTELLEEPEQADQLELTDPRALRALAHPARTAVVDDLYQGNVRTASELAARTGLTPSAMSYHLRALEKWGIVRRAEASADGRERPWRASARGLSWAGQNAGEAVSDAIAGMYLDRLRRDLALARQHEADEPPEWRDLPTINRGFPWLTADEAGELAGLVLDFVQRTAAERSAEDRPDDARRVAYFFALAPAYDDVTDEG